MADLLWDDVSSFFDPDLMGSLPDVRVPNAPVEDWQAVLDLVAEKGWATSVIRCSASMSRPIESFSWQNRGSGE
ncbi:hypothetical protein [Streptomyces mirabilis]|uniref:Ig-like domain-containing protein n=1 Tax=Streptomyces mirabilis TaxID=68239 RepID=A0ABU3V5A9_9ACTN|nr:hypothetical protein [Streptomyces mirabilis]MCX5355713.1 hypothetical protein [Streptomyces mirabilis]MDU9001356.1 hypothetical protein [Streptomyces mirabilis]